MPELFPCAADFLVTTLFALSQEKLFASKNRTECSLGKKLKIDMLPDIEKEHKVRKSVF